MSSGALAPSATASLPVHPSELYECVGGLLLVAFALGMRRRVRHAGDAALAVGLGYLAMRVLVDLSRPASPDVWCARFVLVAAAATALWLVPRARARHP